MDGQEVQTTDDKDKEMKELKILEWELKTLKKGAKVYHQQPNSNILFLSSKDKELARVTEKMNNLKKVS